MNTWIYLKSDNPADALALATVLSNTNKCYNVVRRSINSFVYSGLDNVNVDFYSNSKEDNLLVIDSIPNKSWQGKCKIIADILGLVVEKQYSPYLGCLIKYPEIEKMMGKEKSILLYLFPHPDQKLNLMVIDQLTKIFELKGTNAISGGTNAMPCIRGTKDLRQIMDIPILCSMKDKIEFVLTSEESIKTIGEALGLKVYVVSDVSGLTIDNIEVSDANQMANYIMMNLKPKK